MALIEELRFVRILVRRNEHVLGGHVDEFLRVSECEDRIFDGFWFVFFCHLFYTVGFDELIDSLLDILFNLVEILLLLVFVKDIVDVTLKQTVRNNGFVRLFPKKLLVCRRERLLLSRITHGHDVSKVEDLIIDGGLGDRTLLISFFH